jgi:hypothetical protein
MPKIEINLDAYRLAAECLFRIRQLMRETLKATYGDEWDQEGIPDELHGHLISRRTREASINWHLSDSADLLDYTGFANIYEIIAANETLLDLFSVLAPDPNVLRIRFLELDTILNRIAYVRPVADTEIGFLVSFDERIRRLSAVPAGQRQAAAKPAAARGSQKRESKPTPEPAPTEPKSPPVAPVKEKKGDAAPVRETAPAPAAEPPAAPPAPAPQKPTAEAPSDSHLDEALLAGRDNVVLAALYREITSLADGLWTQAAPALAVTWERVRESDWYNDRFTKLGLNSVSDFYGLVEEARERLLAGTSRNELQEFLKERNFAQVLLSLRELFRHHLAG